MNPDASGFDDGQHVCDICGNIMLERNCKMVCLNCGYTRDCGDP